MNSVSAKSAVFEADDDSSNQGAADVPVIDAPTGEHVSETLFAWKLLG